MTTCLLCASHDGGPVVNRIARNGTPQVSVSCARCGFVQAEPMPTAEELAEYYSSGLYRTQFPALYTPEQMEEHARLTAEFLVHELSLTPGMRVHEVGAGYGLVADALSDLIPTPDVSMDEGGTDVRITAWDPDPAVRATWWKPRGRKHPSAAPLEHPTNRDVVYALQVLEHTPDPVATLREWRLLLAEGGRVHVQVPTLERIYGGPSHFFQWPHVVNFTSRTLRIALLMAGLRPVRMAIAGAVLWATAERAEPMSYDEAAASVGGERDDVPAMLAAQGAPRVSGTAPPGSVLAMLDGPIDDMLAKLPPEGAAYRELLEWLRSVPNAPPVVVQQMGRALAELGRTSRMFATYVEALQAEAEARQEDWHPDPWQWGYRCGRLREMEAEQQRVTALVNAMIHRTGG